MIDDEARDLIQQMAEALEYEGHMPQDKSWEGGLIERARAYLAQHHREETNAMASNTHLVTALPVTKAEQAALDYLATGGDFRAYQRMRQIEQERQQLEQRCRHNRRFFANLTFTP